MHMSMGLIFGAIFIALNTAVSLIYFETNVNSEDKTCKKNNFYHIMLLFYVLLSLLFRIFINENGAIIVIIYQLVGSIIIFYNLNIGDNNPYYDRNI